MAGRSLFIHYWKHMAKALKVTPVGVAVYPHLTQPDTKYEADGVWHTKLNVTDKKYAAALVQGINEAAEAALAAAKDEAKGKKPAKGQKPPKLALCDDMPYTVEEDGTTTFNFKMYAQGKDDKGKVFFMRPTIVDAKGAGIKGRVKIGNDSELRLSFELHSWYKPKIGAGVTLRLYGVQIVKLVEFGGRSAESLGFDAVEGGFDASEYDFGDETASTTGRSEPDADFDEDEGEDFNEDAENASPDGEDDDF